VEIPLLVILAGGASSRLWPLEEKSLIKFMGRPLLSVQLENYAQLGLRQAVVVANPDNEAQIRALVATIRDVQVEVVVQREPRGMGDAVLQVDDYLAAHGDRPIYITQVHDLTNVELHQRMLTEYESASAQSYLAGYRVSEYFPGGYLEVDGEGRITNIIEKPGAGNEPSDLVSIVAHIHANPRLLLDCIREEYAKPAHSDDHYERAMARLMKEHVFRVVPYDGSWQALKYPWHVLDVMMAFLQGIQGQYISPEASIEDGVLIKGAIYLAGGKHRGWRLDQRGCRDRGGRAAVSRGDGRRPGVYRQGRDCREWRARARIDDLRWGGRGFCDRGRAELYG